MAKENKKMDAAIEKNKGALKTAAKIELGHVAIKQFKSKVTPKLPMYLKGIQ